MNRLLSIAKDHLIGLSLHSFLLLIKRSLFRDDIIRIYGLESPELGSIEPTGFDSTQIRKGSISDLSTIEKGFSPVPWEFRCHKYDGVRDSFIAADCHGVQHISWIYYQGDPNRIIKLGPKDAEIKYSLTLPSFRGKGLYPAVLKTIVYYLGQRGFCRVFISVEVDNVASIRGIKKAGFECLCQIHLRKIMAIQVSDKYIPPEI